MRRATMLAGVAVLAAGVGPAGADDELAGQTVIFARGSSLYQVDARGKGETEIAQLAPRLPAPGPSRAKPSRGGGTGEAAPAVTVRALRTDARGTVLLADLAGKWAWLPLDGSTKALIELPCADGPAQVAEDGSAVVCRSPAAANRTIVVDLASTRASGAATAGGAATAVAPAVVAIDVPPASVRLVGVGIERRLVWADAGGVWSSPERDPRPKTRAAPDAPVRGFLASPDGTRGIGVYADEVFSDLRHTRPAEVLMTVQLDGQGARRKTIRDGVAVEWSHDAQWVLVQDGASACIIRAGGGQYKCWRGYTAASLSSDGRWGLVLGNRDGSKKQTQPKAKPAPPPRPARPAPPPASPDAKPWDLIDEPSDEPEAGEAPPASDDVSVAPPSGPLALYRVRLEGAFTDRPTLLVKVIDGAAVWVPKSAP